MAMDKNIMDLFQSQFKDDVSVSRVSEDLKGKVIVIYGGNNLGKTYQCSRFENPIFIPCEKGMNAVNGAMVLKTRSWADLKKHGRKLAGKNFVEALKNGANITLVIDGIERIGNYVKSYLCSKYDVDVIGDARNGFGCWEEYDNLVWSWVDNIISLGYTVVFIGHEKEDKKKGKYVIAGDERAIKPIRDNADIVAYLVPNGLDEEGNEIHSSAYFAETEEFFARSRFNYMPPMIEDFTAENFKKAVVEGIKAQNKAEGCENVTFEQQQEVYGDDSETFEDVVAEIKDLYSSIAETGNETALEGYASVVESHLGEGVLVSQATPKQLEALKCIRDEVSEILDELD